MKSIKYAAEIAPPALNGFRESVLLWYRNHGRDLPWRRTNDPYAILVSEIMLHQTTVAIVEPVFQEFLRAFPTIEALHEAPLDAVKAITDPLGYKVRGRWLKEIARVVVEDLDGQWPRTVEGLMKLPGVGRYTAGALMSFAFGIDAPILDTNVKRVLGRYFGIEYRDSRAEVQHHLWALAEAVVPDGEASLFNQALMDFGAMVCTARKPGCTVCPACQVCSSAMGASETAAAEEHSMYRIMPRSEALSSS